MKKILSFVLCTALLLSAFPLCIVQAEENVRKVYYSEENPPVLYGAGEITLPTGTAFDKNDTRFRVFATDFEDRDISGKIKIFGSVDTSTPGDCILQYSVTDSHNNESKLSVPVHVSDTAEKITVKRIMYTLPSTWNTDICGFYRGTRGDRQILGIFLPSGSSFDIKALDTDYDLTVNCFGNNSQNETAFTVKKNGDTVTVRNTGKNGDAPSVPLIKTVVTGEGTDINRTFTAEISYDPSMPELNFYHIGDSETAFREKWDNEKNSFGVLECSAALFVVPYEDIVYSVGYYKTGFSSLDSFLGYFIAFTGKMDEYVGLELNPENPLHQNVRAKYTVKANASGGGAAYYGTDHVGINSSSIKAIFDHGWGTLHEFAHGYQGSLGKGDDLNEVSNNILGHYIQIDKSIYEAPGDWLGSYVAREDAFHKGRLSTGAATDVSARLYMICKLFDFFEGGNTYSEIFRLYREQLYAGRTDFYKYDAYAEAIAEKYGVNVIPYLSAWGITNSPETKDKIVSMGLPAINILSDFVSDETRSLIMTGEGIEEKYEIVSNEIFEKYNVNGSLKIKILTDDTSVTEGKTAFLKNEKGTAASAVIENSQAEFKNIPVGAYTLFMPVSAEHSCPCVFVRVTEKGEETEYTYERLSPLSDSEKLCIKGIYNTYGFTAVFDGTFTKAQITLGGANMNYTHPYVKIYDPSGKVILDENSEMYEGRYFDYQKPSYTLDVCKGCVIEAYHVTPGNIMVFGNNTGEKIASLSPSQGGVVKYVITEKGLRLENQADRDAENILYFLIKPQAEKILKSYKEKVTTAEIENRYTNMSEKATVFSAYSFLRQEDAEEYKELIEGLKKGGSPIVTGEKNINVKPGEAPDFYSYIEIYDNEDGVIVPSENSVTIKTDLDTGKSGVYSIVYTVKDSDGNTSVFTIKATVKIDKPVTPVTEKCNCICHKSGLIGFFGKIALFFWKLFKIRPVCDCGKNHY